MFHKIFPFARSLGQHRFLLWQFTRRNFELTIRGSHLGLLWSILNPLLLMGLYVYVFGYIFGGSYGVIPHESTLDYAMGIFLSLTVFNLVSDVVCIGPTIIIANPNFVKKVVFPLEILPAAAVGASVMRFFISIFLVFGGIALGGIHLTWAACWLFPIMLPILFLCLGISWAISALGVFFRDIGQLTIFLSQALLYASAIFYSPRIIPHHGLWQVLLYNPLLIAVDLVRDVVLWRLPVSWSHLTYLYVVGMAACSLGYALFQRLKPSFADVL